MSLCLKQFSLKHTILFFITCLGRVLVLTRLDMRPCYVLSENVGFTFTASSYKGHNWSASEGFLCLIPLPAQNCAHWNIAILVKSYSCYSFNYSRLQKYNNSITRNEAIKKNKTEEKSRRWFYFEPKLTGSWLTTRRLFWFQGSLARLD